MRKAFLLLLLGIWTNAGAADFVEGTDYRRLEPAIHADADIIEVFTYACVHCYEAEHEVNLFLSKKPQTVAFARRPVSYGYKKAIVGSYAYYVAKRLGILDAVHEDLFSAIHDPNYRKTHQTTNPEGKQRLAMLPDDILGGTDKLAGYFLYQGVDRETFQRTLTEVEKSDVIATDDRFAIDIKLTGTPSFLIRGKYVIDGMDASHKGEKFVELVNYLLSR